MTEMPLVLGALTAFSDPAPADGSVTDLTVNRDGRLRVSTKPGYSEDARGDLISTSAAPTNVVAGVAGTGFLALDVTDASNVVLHVKNVGSVTMSAGSFSFEGSIDSTTGIDGTWFTIQVVRSNSNTVESATGTVSLTASSGQSYAWEASVNAYAWIRVRCTVNVTASSIARWTIKRGAYATEPIPAIQVTGTQPVSGTVTANQGTLTTPTASNINSAANTNLTAVKTSAGTVYNIAAFNSGVSPAYVKLYNKASAPVSTDVPIMVITVPAGQNAIQNFGLLGHRFTPGIGLAITGGTADNDTTAVAASQVKVITSYI